MKRLERLGVFNAPCLLPCGTKRVKTRAILKNSVLRLEWWSDGRLGWWPRDFFKHSVWILRHLCSSYTDDFVSYIYALSVYLNLFIESIDMDVAFLNATLKENVDIDPPAGHPPVAKGLVLKLNKALYGLKQSPREWNETLDTFLRLEFKMTRLKTKHCIYERFHEDRSEYIILALYVDGLVKPSTTQVAIMKFKQ